MAKTSFFNWIRSSKTYKVHVYTSSDHITSEPTQMDMRELTQLSLRCKSGQEFIERINSPVIQQQPKVEYGVTELKE